MANLFNHAYPYLDEHELNLDWLIAKMKELNIAFEEFKVVNNITFSGQWDITKQYPAWTIVSDNNIGYVSLQPVPVGVPLTNGAYWVEVIDYTAQIAGLQNRVIALEGDMVTAQGDITNLQTDVSRMTMAGRTFLFVGDSYASQSNTWVTPCVNAAGIVNYNNLAVSGSAFFDGTFLSQITGYTGDRDDVTDIVVGGGLNDAKFNSTNADYNTCKQAIIDFATYAKANYPNATLYLAFMGNALDDAPLLSGRTYDKRIWAKWCYELIGREYGYNIIHGCDEALATNSLNFNSDHIHPAAGGAYSIGYCMANALLGYEPIRIYPELKCALTAIGNNALVSTTNLQYACNNGMFDFTVSEPFAVQIGTDNPSFSSSTKIELVTMTELYFNKRCVIPVMARIDNYNNKNFQNVPMVLIFEGNKICFQCDMINSTNNGFETFATTIPGAQVCVQRGVTFSIPAYYIN